MLTRWDEWYSPENLAKDARIQAAPPSKTAQMAATEFLKRGIRHILDLACGIGRDTFYLSAQGLSVLGTDASFNGITIAQHTRFERNLETGFTVSDARHLPFGNCSFEGIYSFGLLHEFTSPNKDVDVRLVLSEVERLLVDQGLLVIAVAAGNPEVGLPQVQLFSRQMFENVMHRWHTLEIKAFDDIGCTNRTDYHIWYGLFQKPPS